MKTDERAIAELIASWHERTRKGDVDGVLELMTDDVVFTVVGRPPFGKQEFAETSRQIQGKVQSTYELLEVTVRGDTGWSRVRLQVNMTRPDGKEVQRDGYAMSLYVKAADGRWRLARDANLLPSPS